MAASAGSSDAWELPSRPSAVSELRHRAAAFAAAAGASDEVTEAIALAVSETVSNVILHAYDGEEGEVRVSCGVDGERFIVEVVDDGGGIAARQDSPGSVMVSPWSAQWPSRSISLLPPADVARP